MRTGPKSDAEPFGAVLKRLILRHYPSQKAFSEAVGMTPARASQLVRGGDDTLSYAVVRDLLGVFRHRSDQALLYLAWQHTFAPPPPPQVEGAEGSWTDDRIEATLSDCESRVAGGQALTVARELRRLYDLLVRQDRTCEAFQVGTRLAETLFLLDRRPQGIALVDELVSLAKSTGEALLIADALRLRAVGLRPIRLSDPSQVMLAFEDFGAALACGPAGATAPLPWRNHQSSLARDRALFAWDLLRTGAVHGEFGESALKSLRREIARQSDVSDNLLELEAAARLATSLGDPDLADRYLTRAERINGGNGRSLAGVKLALTRARISLAAEEADPAVRVAIEVLEIADEHHYLHYHQEANRLLYLASR